MATIYVSFWTQKNVYSVFSSSPPSVGFAQLSDAAGGAQGTPPSSLSASGASLTSTSNSVRPAPSSESLPIPSVTFISSAPQPSGTESAHTGINPGVPTGSSSSTSDGTSSAALRAADLSLSGATAMALAATVLCGALGSWSIWLS